MGKTLKETFLADFDIRPTDAQARRLLDTVKRYELQYAEAFNSPYLAVSDAYFLPKDASAIFEIFGVDQSAFGAAVKSVPAINDQYHVSSNDFNQLIMWLVWCFQRSNLPAQLKYDSQLYLVMQLNYKFFCGITHEFFPYGAKEDVMRYTIENLTAKSDIKNEDTATWRAILRKHATGFLDSTSVHIKTIRDYEPDKAVVYMITDLHTRIFSKVRLVASAYYDNVKKGNTIGSSSATMTNDEGEEEMKALKATLDNSILQINTIVPNVHTFIDEERVKLCANLASNIRPDMLRAVLVTFSGQATIQYQSGTTEDILVEKQKKNTIYIGYKILIREMVQKTYRWCSLHGVDMKTPSAILRETSSVYRASRLSDPDLLKIKDSVDYFLKLNTAYKRDATLVSLRIAFILYIICLTFKYR